MAPSRSPYAQAMLDYWHGESETMYNIHRDDGFFDVMPASASFAGEPFNPLEQLALERATGRVLDVGAGVGRHALFLQERGGPVTAIEIEPDLVNIMAERGVAEPLAGSVFSLDGRQCDTILMLMNGFGLVGTLAGADAFFKRARHLLSATGQILCDSFDVRRTTNPMHLAYHEANLRMGRPAGQMRFSIEYQDRRGEAFDWLYIDFAALRDIAGRHGLSAELLAQEESGHYLSRLVYGNTRIAQPL
jgi:SAM-dependent methyltransferase